MDDLSDLDVAILTGGLGTRLRPVLPDLPKGLAPVGGRPFLTHLLDRLAAAGAARAVLLTGHMGDMIEAALGPDYKGLRLSYSREPSPLDTGGALRLAAPHFTAEAVLVINGDSLIKADLPAFRRWFAASGAPVGLLAVAVPDASRFGRVRLDQDGAVLAFAEKSEPGPGLINAGVYLFRRPAVASIPAGRPISLERQLFPALVGRGLMGFAVEAAFLDIGCPESLKRAEAFLAGGAEA